MAHAPIKYVEKGLSYVANGLWYGYAAVSKLAQRESFTPRWSDKPLLKSWQKTKPPLGFPRETDSLCPTCVREARQSILDGRQDVSILLKEKVGEIKAQIIERDGQILMVKDCPLHGHFEDVMSIDPEMFQHLEAVFPGRDIAAHNDETLHNHGSSTIKHGRGSVLTVDLTNRCNMMCDPCFMDANQVGYVHELAWEEIKEILDNALSVRPRRQMSVQFSGGEPTLSPHFLPAIRYARELGYFSVQCATNGVRFAQEPLFAKAAARAGLRLAYLQFDGVGNSENRHRGVSNLFDVKEAALDALKAAGIDATLVVTVVKGVNDGQVGEIVRFATRNIDRINALSFQPVSFTGRDEEVDDETRRRRRYTLSHLAHDVKRQAGLGEPMRDWFPLSASSPFSDLRDLLGGLEAEWGSLKCGCHPNCGVAMMVLVRPDTGQAVPVTQFLDADRFLRDLAVITDAARGRLLTIVQAALAVARNIRPDGVPEGLGLLETLKVLDGHAGTGMGIAKTGRHPWRVLLVAGMWFQDLFNYDFRRTEMCIIPYGTQAGEISFCAYNTGAGWRKVVEEMHRSATLAQWYKDKGRHPVYAGGARIPLPAYGPASPPVTLPVAARTATPAPRTMLPSLTPVAGK